MHIHNDRSIDFWVNPHSGGYSMVPARCSIHSEFAGNSCVGFAGPKRFMSRHVHVRPNYRYEHLTIEAVSRPVRKIRMRKTSPLVRSQRDQLELHKWEDDGGAVVSSNNR